MGKKFNLLTTISSNEVSLCSKYNSGANKQTEFEIVKDKEKQKDKTDIKSVIKDMYDMYDEIAEIEQEEPSALDTFQEFLAYWLEYDVNNAYYNCLSEGLQQALCDIKYLDADKDEKVRRYKELFNMFINEFNSLPITKTQDGKFEVSLVSKSHIKEQETNPQNETNDITKENTSEMKNEEKQTMFEQALNLLKSAFGLEKTETPNEQPEVEEEKVENEEGTQEGETTEEKPEGEKTVETPEGEPSEKQPEKQVEADTPVVEKEVEEKADEEPKEVEKTSNSEVEELLKAKLEVEKELEELKKANEEREVAIEKMSYIQKAKVEYSMLVGTPEEIGAKLYEINKSSLTNDIKDFIMEQLKKVAKENESLTQEIGSVTKSTENMTDEEVIYQKAKELAKSKNISINKALREIK